MSYPAKYPPAVNPENWNAMVDFFNGFTPEGIFKNPYDYMIVTDGTNYYACNSYQIIFGGPDDAGGVDGEDANAVIKAVFATADCVYLGPGIFEIDGTDMITITRSMDVFGAGIGKTILKDMVGSTVEWFRVNASHVRIEGITFDGNNLSKAMFHIKRHETDGDIFDIVIRDCQFTNMPTGHVAGGLVTVWDVEQKDLRLYDVTFDRCIFNNDPETTYDNVAVSYCKNVTFRDCYFDLSKVVILYNSEECRVIGCVFTGFSAFSNLVLGRRKHVVSGCLFSNPGVSVSLRIVSEGSDSGYHTISNNTFVGSYINLDDAAGSISHVTIANNIFDTSASYAIGVAADVNAITDINIIGNSINDSVGHGIYVEARAQRITITGNVLETIGTGPDAYKGIYLYQCTKCVVNSNCIRNPDSYGIYLNGATYNIIDGNQIVNSTSYAILEAGAADYNIVSNNIAERAGSSTAITTIGAHSIEDNNIEIAS